MNHTYRVVYNETTNTYVAVAEFTPAKGKKSKSAKSAASKAVLAVAAVGLAGSAWAAKVDGNPIGTTQNGNLVITGNNENYPIPDNGTKNQENTVIGIKASVASAPSASGINDLHPDDRHGNGKSVVLGNSAQSKTSSTVTIGHSADSGSNHGAVTIGYQAKGETRTATKNGQQASIGGSNHVVYNNLYNRQSLVRFSSRPNVIGRLDGTRVQSAGVAVGRRAESQGAGVAVGDEARVLVGTGRALGVALGAYALSEGGGVAIGGATEATGTNSMAFGRQAAAKATVSQAIGSASATHQDAQGATAIGHSATAVGVRSIAFGSSSSDEKYESRDNTVALGTDDVAIGSNAVSSGISDAARAKVAEVMEAIATEANKVQNNGTSASSAAQVKAILTAKRQELAALGIAEAEINTVAALLDNVAAGKLAETAFTVNQNLQKLVVRGSESVAIGKSSRTFRDRAIAVGKTAHADGNDTISVGTNAKTTYQDSIAIGRDTLAAPATYGVHRPAIAIGTKVTVTGNSSIAIGTLGDWRPADNQKTWNHGTDSLVIGSNSHIGTENLTDGERPLAVIGIGNDVRVGNGVQYSAVIGDNGASYRSSGAVYGAFAKGFAEGSVAVGRDAQAGRGKQSDATVRDGYDYRDTATDIGGEYATSVGAYSRATHDNSSAFGRNAAAVADEATALGVYAKATAERATAAGNQAQALRRHAVAVGGGSKDSSNVDEKARAATASAESAIAIGHLSRASGSQSIAIGEGADTLNRAEFNKGWNAASANRNDAGYTAAAEHTKNAIAIGTQAKAFNKDTVAIGRASRAEGESSIAIGTGNVVKGNYSGAVGDPSVVAGAESYTYGNDNVVGSSTTGGFAFGNNNQIGARPVYDTAAGRERKVDPSKSLTNETNASNSTAIGNENAVTSKDTFILGSGINTKRNGERIEVIGETVENSVYLGKDSTAKAGAGTVNNGSGSLKNQKDDGTDGSSTTAGATGTVNDATVGKLKYSGFQGATAAGVVTVGSAGKERRLQNVAAGEISKTSTDAINGSQLYATNNVLNNLAKFTAQHLGGGATLNDNGSINAPTYNVYKGNTSPATAGSGTTQFVNPASNVGAAITNLNTYINQGFNVKDHSDVVKGVVTPGESIQFVNGTNTTVNVTQEKNGVTKIAINATATAPAAATTVSAGDTNIAVTPSGTNPKDYAVKLNPVVTVGGPAPAGGANSGAKPVKIDGTAGTVSGLSNITFDPNQTYKGGQAATQEQLSAAYKAGGFTLNTEAATGGTAVAAAGKTMSSKVNNGDTVTIVAGQGIKTTQDDDKITIEADIGKGTLTADTGANEGKAKGSSDDLKNLATTNAVAQAINNSGFKLSGEGETKNAELVNPGDTLNFKNGKGTTAKVDGLNVTYDINTAAAPTHTNGVVGKPSTGGDNSFFTANQVADAINNSAFFVNSGKVHSGSNTGAASTAVKAGEEVKFIADNGISITQQGKNFTFGLQVDNSTIKLENGVLKAVGGKGSPYSFSVGDVNGVQEVVKSGQTLQFGETQDDLILPSVNANGGNGPIVSFKPQLVGKVPIETTGQVKVIGTGKIENKLVSGEKLADAVNNSFWRFNIEAGGGTAETASQDAKVRAGNKVTFVAGENITLEQDSASQKLTISAKAQPVGLGTVSINSDGSVSGNGDTTNDLTSADAVANAINSSGWNIKGNGQQKDLVTAGNSVNFVNGAGSSVTVTPDAATGETTVKIDTPMAYVNAASTDQSTPSNTVKLISGGADPVQVQNVASGVRDTVNPAAAGNPTAAETAKAVADATGDTLKNAVNVGDLKAVQQDLKDTPLKFAGDDGTEVSRKLGETLTVKGDADPTKLTDNNIGVVADGTGGGLKVKLAENINLGDSGSLKFGDNGPTVNKTGINMQDTAISNLKGNLNPTYNNGDNKIGADGKPDGTNVTAADITKSAAAPSVADVKNIYNNAATVGDVLNAGWNLQGNGDAVDFVKPYDTVNFVNGTGTTVEVKADADGKISNIKVNTLTSLVTADGTPVVQVGDEFYKAEDIDPATGKPLAGKNAIDTAANPISVSIVNPNAATGKTATTDPVQLGNIAAGAKTFAAPQNAAGEDLKLANDGKWYKAADVNADGTTVASAVAQTPAQPVSGSLNGGLIDFANSNPTNALTVADAQNMGWVVSADGGYSDQVRNANEVKFVGANGAKVTGETKDGVRTITVEIDAQKATEAAQLPVVYTDKDGNKLIKGKDAADKDVFYPATVTLGADGKPTDTADYAKAIDPAAKPGDIIASMNNGGNSTTAPTQLANVKGNLAPTYNKGDAEEDATSGKLGTATAAAATKSAAAPTADEIKAIYNNAATVGDVLNAGFNLQGNGEAVDFVKPYDTVNFVNGTGTTVEVKADADGKISNIKVNTLTSLVTADGTPVVQVGDKFYKAEDIDPATGKPLAGKNAIDTAANPISVSIVNPNAAIGKTATTDPVQLGNIKGNLNRVDKDGLVTAPDGTTVTAAAADNLKQAPALPTAFDENAAGYDPKVLNNAATMGDVLNAGWNLKENGEARDFVRHTDSVEFINGGNTIAVVETAADGSGSKIGVHITGLPVQYVSDNGTPVVKVGDEYFEVDADGKPTTTKVDADKLTANVINPAAPKNGKGDATQLGNVAAGAKTFDAPTNANGDKLKLANDGKWYQNVDANGVGTGTPETPSFNAGNKTGGLIDFAKSNPTNALTVADAQNMGWVVSADGGYSDQVRNANEVKFVGANGAKVTGETVDGVRTITVDVNAQSVSNASQLPAVYTKADGSKVALNPADNKFYPAKADGSPDTAQAEVPKSDVIVSLNNGDNSSTAPTQLANVKGNLAPTYNEGDNKIGADGKPDGTTTAKADVTKSVINPLNAAATTAATADEIKAIYNNAATVGDVLNAGFNLQANGTAVDFVKPYDTVNFVDGFGAKVTATNTDGKTTNIRIDTPMAYVDANGATEAGGKPVDPSNTVKMIGKDDTKPVAVQNVASGVRDTVKPAGTTPTAAETAKAIADATDDTLNNAVNVGDLKAVQAGLTAAATQPLTFAGDSGNVTRKLGETLNIKGGATGTLTENNIGVVADSATNTLTVKLAENIDLGQDGSVKMGDTTVNNDGLTIKGGPSVTKGGINAGGVKITDVANGVDDNDAVNVSQLKGVSNNVTNVQNNLDAIKNLLTGGTDPATIDVVTYNVEDRTERHHNNLVEAVNQMNKEGIRFFHTNDGTITVKNDGSNTVDSSAGGDYSTAIGYKATVTAGSENALAVGAFSKAEAAKTVAIGHQAQATGIQAIAIGDGAKASGLQSISIGTGNDVRGEHSGAIGDPTYIAADSSYAIGNNNKIGSGSDNTFILGNNVQIADNTANVVALGHNTAVSQANGVALGASSKAERDAIAATAAVSNKIGTTSVGTAYTGSEVYVMQGASKQAKDDVVATAKTTLAAVSVGSATQNRQITGVAAGSLDNDAVNVAQLRSVQSANQTQINNLGNRLNQLGDQIGDVAGGVAQGLATAGLPQAYLPGKSLIAAGVGYFQGHTGYAVGISSISDGGNWIIKGTASGSTRGGFGASAAIGYQW